MFLFHLILKIIFIFEPIGDGGLQILSSGLKLEPHSILRLESFLGNFERDFCPLTRLYPEVVNQVSDGLGI